MMQDFLIHKKAVPYAVKPEADNGPYYLKSTIDYIKYLVTELETDQPITDRTISIVSTQVLSQPFGF